MDYKNELNKEQYEAVVHTEGPLLILAGAGSGKTRVITYRIAYLIEECGVYPESILAITFTNKAAREMRERVENLLQEDISRMWISTFHAFCGRILRRHAELIGYTSSFVIYDDQETNAVLKDCLKKLNIDNDKFPVALVKSIISKAKEKMQDPEAFQAQSDMRDPNARKVVELYKLYQQALVTNNAMDFDDMLCCAVRLFQENPDVLEYYRNKFKYVMVDEYQDTNHVQYRLVSMLAAHGNICVVGDDDQSIYSFRGADITNILDFEKQYKDCKIIKLEQNYRSTQNILNAANGVIANNTSRKSKELWTDAGCGEKIITFTGDDQNEESYFIAREIKRAVENGDYDYRDFTILYRMNALSQNLENAFMRMQIPYRVYGGLKFFERKEIKDIISYLRVFENPTDTVALKRVVNVPRRGIGDTSLGYAEEIAEREGIPLLAVFSQADQYAKLSRAAKSMMSFAEKIFELTMVRDDMGISEFVEFALSDLGMIAEYEAKDTDEDRARIENLKEFVSVATEFEKDAQENMDVENTFSAFLENIALSTDMDNSDNEENSVTMMTIHNSKGLEFPVVFVVGMEDGIFPSSRSIEEGSIDEERRLCYVAITRARKKLYLTHAFSRMQYGKTNMNSPSRFLREVPAEYMEETSLYGKVRSQGSNSFGAFQGRNNGFGGGYSYGRQSSGKSSFGGQSVSIPKKSAAESKPVGFGRSINSVSDVEKLAAAKKAAQSAGDRDFSVGDSVAHAKFGEGIITKMEPSGGDIVVEIQFEKVGMKRFSLAYTKLKKL